MSIFVLFPILLPYIFFCVVHFFLPVSIGDISNCNFIWFNLIWLCWTCFLFFFLLQLIIDFAKLFTTMSISTSFSFHWIRFYFFLSIQTIFHERILLSSINVIFAAPSKIVAYAHWPQIIHFYIDRRKCERFSLVLPSICIKRTKYSMFQKRNCLSLESEKQIPW